MEQPVNLHLESIYLQGARDLLLRLQDMNAILQKIVKFTTKRHSMKYYTIVKVWQSSYKVQVGDITTTKKDKKEKLVSVKIEFNDK